MPGRREQIENMIERRPTDSLLRYALAMEYVSEGDHPSAVAQFQRLQQDTPTYVPGYYQHAKTLMQLQRSEEARQILRTGMVIAQHGGDLHALGEMQELLGSIS
jgi:tetratricopeptide (TPR) repeat protein